MQLNINQPGTLVEWVWKLENYTIGFQATFATAIEESLVVSPITVAASEGEFRGEYVAESPGTLTLKWDNTSSIFRSKRIFYRIKQTVDGKKQASN